MDPFESLFTQPSGSSNADPEVLEMLGRKASQMFQQSGLPLNDAIAQVIAQHPELGNEHIKRIVEFANTVTFQEQFQNSADKNVHFPVADPGVVLRDVKDGGTPSQDGKPLADKGQDYLNPPRNSQGSGFPEAEQLFSNQFSSGNNGGTVDPMAKNASVRTDHSSHANPIDDVYDEYINLKATREKLAEAYESMHNMLESSTAELHGLLRREILEADGAGIDGCVIAMSKVAEDFMVEHLMLPLIEKLAEEGHALSGAFEKKAGIVVNNDHQLLVVTSAITKLASELQVASFALDSVDASIEEAVNFLKSAGNLTTKIKMTVGHKGKVPAGLRQRFKRS